MPLRMNPHPIYFIRNQDVRTGGIGLLDRMKDVKFVSRCMDRRCSVRAGVEYVLVLSTCGVRGRARKIFGGYLCKCPKRALRHLR